MSPQEGACQNDLMQPTRPTQVYIVDDSSSIRSRLAEMLAAMPGVTIAGEAASAADAVDGILLAMPDSVLLDLNLNGRSGIEVLRAVRVQAPGIVFVVLTTTRSPSTGAPAHSPAPRTSSTSPPSSSASATSSRRSPQPGIEKDRHANNHRHQEPGHAH